MSQQPYIIMPTSMSPSSNIQLITENGCSSSTYKIRKQTTEKSYMKRDYTTQLKQNALNTS